MIDRRARLAHPPGHRRSASAAMKPFAPLLLLPLITACAGRYAPPMRCPSPAGLAPAPRRVALVDSERVPTADAPRLGPEDAPLTVVVFSDFQCPYCARARAALSDLRALFPDQVRVVWRNLPLLRHPLAHLAAEAAMEVRAQAGDAAFWRYHDLLFAHQSTLSREGLVRDARVVGADVARLERALDDGLHRDAVDADAALAQSLGVDGTPAFVLNGTRVTGLQPFGVFESAARLILARAASMPDPARVYVDMVRDPVALPEPADESRATVDPWAGVHDLPVPTTAPSRGPADAPVTLQVFGDFECPFCARARRTLDALRERYGARLRVVWRDLPLPRHPHALAAAEAAREVLAQAGPAGFWRMHDLLFEAHDGERPLEPGLIERFAVEAGADRAALRVALADHRHRAVIDADAAAAAATGLRLGTPSFFLNGHLVSGARPVAEFQQRIDSLLGPQ
jgi:protein-disulfide isomerase